LFYKIKLKISLFIQQLYLCKKVNDIFVLFIWSGAFAHCRSICHAFC